MTSIELVTQEAVIKSEEWYQSMVDDITAINVETKTTAAVTVLHGKWEIGQKIYEEYEGRNRKETYGEGLMQSLSNDVGLSTSDLYACLKFYSKYQLPTFEKVEMELPEGKNMSWYKLKQEYLPDTKRQKKERSTYKISDVLEILGNWLVDEGLVIDSDVKEWVDSFEKLLVLKNK